MPQELRRSGLPPFYQLDLRIDRHVYFDKFQLDLYAELVNATLTQQVYGLDAIGPNMIDSEGPSAGAAVDWRARRVLNRRVRL